MARLLVIDDDEEIRIMLNSLFTDAGYEVDLAADGYEGVEAFKENHADLVITDIFMPNKDGLETIIELKRDYPEIKIIAMSGGGIDTELYLESAKKFGAVATFIKPFLPSELLKEVKKILGETV